MSSFFKKKKKKETRKAKQVLGLQSAGGGRYKEKM
jgi:hypothetical protein